MISPGLHVYIGTTGSGKTYKAIRDAIAHAGETARGVLVIDSRGEGNADGGCLKPIPEMRPTGDLWQAVYAYGQVARVVPRDEAEFDNIIQVVDRTGQLVVLIDEVSPWATNKTLQALCRVWRHRKVSLFITTQKIGRDLEQSILACDPKLYLFRLTAPRSLEWVERWHRIPPEAVKALPVGSYYLRTF